MKITTMINAKCGLKCSQVLLLLYLLICSISLQAQHPSCSACMGGFHGEPDEYVDVLIQYNQGEEPVVQKAARYGETVVYGGDVVMTNNYSGEIALRGTVVSDFSRLWPNSTIPYIWGNGLSQSMRNTILAAINEINAQTNLCVVERTNEAAYVIFESNGGDGQCYVLGIGNLGTPNQTVNLGPDCESKGTVIHELLHKAGFFHEQTHPDRDNFITVNWANLDGQLWTNQFIQQSDAQAAGAYDFASIMHYPQYHPQPTINDDEPLFFINNGVTVPTGVNIGYMPGMSSTDIAAVNSLYSCGTGGGGGPTCSDGILNQGETGIDCGGPCAPCNTGTCVYTISNSSSCTYDVFWWDGTDFTYAGRTDAYSNISLTATNGMQFAAYNTSDYAYNTDFVTVSCANPYYNISQNLCGGGVATCTDGIQNQGETGIDCGGPCAACPTCYDGIQNQGETGVDCGGPCSPCNTGTCSYTISNSTSCTHDVFWWDGTDFTYAGRTSPYSSITVTATNGLQFAAYNVFDYGFNTGFITASCANPYYNITQNLCAGVATCTDGIQNQGETGIDCGGPCAACPTCYDGIQNQGETGIDCGGPCTPCTSNCTYTITNNTGCTYDIFWWDGANFTYAGRTNAYTNISVTAVNGMQFGVYDANDYANFAGFTTVNCASPYHTITQSVCSTTGGGGGTCSYTVTNYTGCTYDYHWWDGTTFIYAGRTDPYTYLTVTATDGMELWAYDSYNYDNFLGTINASCANPSYGVTQIICGSDSPVAESDDLTVTRFVVYPNPLQTQGTIEYTLWKDNQVTIYVSDLTGKKVAVLSNHEQQSKGIHKVNFDGSDLSSGIYYCTIVASDYVNTQKIILTK